MCVFAKDQKVIFIVIIDTSNGSRFVDPMVTKCNQQILSFFIHNSAVIQFNSIINFSREKNHNVQIFHESL
jgi:hypothetical protein